MDEDFTNVCPAMPQRFIQRANMSIDAPGNDINPYKYSDIKINPLNSFQGAFEPTSINPYQHSDIKINPYGHPYGNDINPYEYSDIKINPLNSFQGAFEPTSINPYQHSDIKINPYGHPYGNDINPYEYSDIKINPYEQHVNYFQGAFEPTSINPYQHSDIKINPFGNPLNSFQGAFEPTSMQGDAFSTSKLLQKRFNQKEARYKRRIITQLFRSGQPLGCSGTKGTKSRRNSTRTPHTTIESKILFSETDLTFLLQKKLTRSDVSNLGRIIISKRDAKAYLPSLKVDEVKHIEVEDFTTTDIWHLWFRYWLNNKSRMYVLENTGDFVKVHNLKEGDYMMLYQDQSGKYIMKGRRETNSHPIPCSPKDEEYENGDKVKLNIFEVEEHENGDKIELSSSTICEMSPDKSEGYDIASLFNTCIMDFDISEIFSN